jgi:hypothetical protein
VFTGLDELYEFAKRAYFGRNPQDFEVAADHLAKAVAILGIQAVLAVVFRGARVPKTYRGGRLTLETPPPRAPGLRYTPTVVEDATLAAGEALVVLHERVHQFLAPKLYLLREYRVGSNAASYVRSSLWRYIEEALAETIAQVGVNGFRQLLSGIRFPVSNGYVYLAKSGGYSAAFAGAGLAPEAAGLLYTGVVAGLAVEVRFVATNPRGGQRANAAAY